MTKPLFFRVNLGSHHKTQFPDCMTYSTCFVNNHTELCNQLTFAIIFGSFGSKQVTLEVLLADCMTSSDSTCFVAMVEQTVTVNDAQKICRDKYNGSLAVLDSRVKLKAVRNLLDLTGKVQVRESGG